MSKIDDKNQIEKQFMSSQAFHRTPGARELENAVWVQFSLENLESFEPVTQDQCRDVFLQQSIQKTKRNCTRQTSNQAAARKTVLLTDCYGLGRPPLNTAGSDTASALEHKKKTTRSKILQAESSQSGEELVHTETQGALLAVQLTSGMLKRKWASGPKTTTQNRDPAGELMVLRPNQPPVILNETGDRTHNTSYRCKDRHEQIKWRREEPANDSQTGLAAGCTKGVNPKQGWADGKIQTEKIEGLWGNCAGEQIWAKTKQ
jgi:hypothetical protein